MLYIFNLLYLQQEAYLEDLVQLRGQAAAGETVEAYQPQYFEKRILPRDAVLDVLGRDVLVSAMEENYGKSWQKHENTNSKSWLNTLPNILIVRMQKKKNLAV